MQICRFNFLSKIGWSFSKWSSRRQHTNFLVFFMMEWIFFMLWHFILIWINKCLLDQVWVTVFWTVFFRLWLRLLFLNRGSRCLIAIDKFARSFVISFLCYILSFICFFLPSNKNIYRPRSDSRLSKSHRLRFVRRLNLAWLLHSCRLT